MNDAEARYSAIWLKLHEIVVYCIP